MPGLTQRLKEATHALHRQVERTALMSALVHGRLPLHGYRELLCNLRAIYAALEAALARHRAHPAVRPLMLPALPRSAALANDIAELPGADEPFHLDAATTAYVQRLTALSEQAPALLGAHAYVRYLGDLNGGQALARILSTSLGVPVGFYEFGSREDVADLIARFRAALDDLPLTGAEAQAFVDEAMVAFRFHLDLFCHLRGD